MDPHTADKHNAEACMTKDWLRQLQIQNDKAFKRRDGHEYVSLCASECGQI